MTDFPDDWGDSYVEAARVERHRLRARPDAQTGVVEDDHWSDEPEDQEYCEWCDDYGHTQESERCPNHPDHDPTPWCSGCGAPRQSDCDCGPIAENN